MATVTRPTPGPLSQTERLIRFLRANPGASGLEIIRALNLPKYTSRISDARAQGFDVECRKVDGLNRYFLNEQPTQTVLW